MKMIVGLGNPGKDYARTRHNVGFMAIDRLAEQYGISVSKKECRALTGKGIIAGTQVLLVKPQTYMNDSGSAVGQLIHYYDTIDDFIIIHDDMDLPLGKIRFKQKGSAGGHNGIKSVIAHVLSGFHKDEVPVIDDVLSHVDEWLSFWLQEGIVATMNKYN